MAEAQQDSDAASTTSERSGKSASGQIQKPSYKHIPHSQKPPHLVAKRNARERRRVQAVNQAFYRLRKSVPIENRNKRVSKVKTLLRAIDYIRNLERVLAEDDDAAVALAGAGPNPREPSSDCNQAATQETSGQQPTIKSSKSSVTGGGGGGGGGSGRQDKRPAASKRQPKQAGGAAATVRVQKRARKPRAQTSDQATAAADHNQATTAASAGARDLRAAGYHTDREASNLAPATGHQNNNNNYGNTKSQLEPWHHQLEPSLVVSYGRLRAEATDYYALGQQQYNLREQCPLVDSSATQRLPYQHHSYSYHPQHPLINGPPEIISSSSLAGSGGGASESTSIQYYDPPVAYHYHPQQQQQEQPIINHESYSIDSSQQQHRYAAWVEHNHQHQHQHQQQQPAATDGDAEVNEQILALTASAANKDDKSNRAGLFSGDRSAATGRRQFLSQSMPADSTSALVSPASLARSSPPCLSALGSPGPSSLKSLDLSGTSSTGSSKTSDKSSPTTTSRGSSSSSSSIITSAILAPPPPPLERRHNSTPPPPPHAYAASQLRQQVNNYLPRVGPGGHSVLPQQTPGGGEPITSKQRQQQQQNGSRSSPAISPLTPRPLVTTGRADGECLANNNLHGNNDDSRHHQHHQHHQYHHQHDAGQIFQPASYYGHQQQQHHYHHHHHHQLQQHQQSHYQRQQSLGNQQERQHQQQLGSHNHLSDNHLQQQQLTTADCATTTTRSHANGLSVNTSQQHHELSHVAPAAAAAVVMGPQYSTLPL